MSLPSLDTWLHVELPQLRAAFEQTHPGEATPDDWYAFQTYRRYVEPQAWPFDRMLRHERGDDSPVNPQ